MKFVIIFGFCAAIVFDEFNFGQAEVTVEQAQPALAQLFIDFTFAIGDPQNPVEARKNNFNDPNITYAEMKDLIKAAELEFNRYLGYFRRANFYKNDNDDSRESYQKLASALNTYDSSFPGETEYPMKSKNFRMNMFSLHDITPPEMERL